MCLPVRDLDLSYNLISTHDRDGVYVLVDHDEEDVVAANAPINNVYTPGILNLAGMCGISPGHATLSCCQPAASCSAPLFVQRPTDNVHAPYEPPAQLGAGWQLVRGPSLDHLISRMPAQQDLLC